LCLTLLSAAAFLQSSGSAGGNDTVETDYGAATSPPVNSGHEDKESSRGNDTAAVEKHGRTTFVKIGHEDYKYYDKTSYAPQNIMVSIICSFCVALIVAIGLLVFLFETERGRKILKMEKTQRDDSDTDSKLQSKEYLNDF
ncbi:uncharacterized, partial [Lates japonicus]